MVWMRVSTRGAREGWDEMGMLGGGGGRGERGKGGSEEKEEESTLPSGSVEES